MQIQNKMLISKAVVLLLIISPILPSRANPHHKTASVPKFVAYHLAGLHLQKTPNIGLFDPNTQYCFTASSDSSGYHRLILTKDLQFAGYEGGGVPGELTRFRNSFRRVKLLLRTGKGVTIGNSSREVRQKLGTPTKSSYRTYAFGEKLKIYTYQWKHKVNKQARMYVANYTFSHNRLWAIEFVDTPSEVF